MSVCCCRCCCRRLLVVAAAAIFKGGLFQFSGSRVGFVCLFVCLFVLWMHFLHYYSFHLIEPNTYNHYHQNYEEASVQVVAFVFIMRTISSI